MIITREFVEIDTILYEVIRSVKASSNPIVDTWKEHLKADKVFKKHDIFFFCRKIEDAIIEEIVYE